MGGGELLGDAVSAGLTARALEPAAGEPAAAPRADALCRNCGTALIGSHCHRCGQPAHVHRSLAAFLHDLLHGVFHFEGKIWRTLPLLARDPGRLTREYIAGRRASYVSPVALFLFSVFLLFAVEKQISLRFSDLASVSVNGQTATGLAENEAVLGQMRARRAALAAKGQNTEQIDEEIAARAKATSILRKIDDPAAAAGAAIGDDAVKGDDVAKTAGTRSATLRSNISWLDRAIHQARADPQLALYKLQTYAYKYSWALIPISVPLVWLLFPFNRRFGLYDHTVFVTYSLCFMSLLLIVLSLARAAHVPMTGVALMVIAPWHMFRQLRGAYALSIAGAVWRTAALLAIALTALILWSLLIIAQTGH